MPVVDDWHRTKQGNLSRCVDGHRHSVFMRKGFYYWCIDDMRLSETYSPGGFRTEQEALNDLEDYLNQ